MERKFCGICGQPLGTCSCDRSSFQRYGTTAFHAQKSGVVENNQSSTYIISQFDNVALSQGEIPIRQYHIGKFSGLLSLFGQGNSYMLITNRRVISKSDTNYFGTSNNSVEEIALENITGMKTMYDKGITIWKLILGIIFILFSLFTLDTFEGWLSLALGIFLIFWCRKPSYLFHLYSNSSAPTMTTGANLRGKLMNASGYGLIFQFKPTQEAIPMMREIGACINDLRTKGDYAVEAWRNV